MSMGYYHELIEGDEYVFLEATRLKDGYIRQPGEVVICVNPEERIFKTIISANKSYNEKNYEVKYKIPLTTIRQHMMSRRGVERIQNHIKIKELVK